MTRTVENKNVVAVNEGVKTMENKEQQFNTIDWVKCNILKAYYNALVNKEIPEDGIYEVEIKDGTYEYELEIDAQTGEVLSLEKDYED